MPSPHEMLLVLLAMAMLFSLVGVVGLVNRFIRQSRQRTVAAEIELADAEGRPVHPDLIDALYGYDH